MADIIIRRKLALDFLGEEYKSDYLTFKAIPVSEYSKIVDKQPDDNVEAVNFIVKMLAERFIEGRFQEQDVTKEDIGKFDADVVTSCFAMLTGQKPDPKV